MVAHVTRGLGTLRTRVDGEDNMPHMVGGRGGEGGRGMSDGEGGVLMVMAGVLYAEMWEGLRS